MNAGLLSKAGLGSVLAKVCHVDSDKGIALADWRVRPLPAEELAYSVLDVLYLQYIARALIRMILDNGASAPPLLPASKPCFYTSAEAARSPYLRGTDRLFVRRRVLMLDVCRRQRAATCAKDPPPQ